MSQEDQEKNGVCGQSKALLKGRLKHTRTAALALALVPLAAIAVSTAVNEDCLSGGICGTVFYDQNGNGVQDDGEPGIEGAIVTLVYTYEGLPYEIPVYTNPDGFYEFGNWPRSW